MNKDQGKGESKEGVKAFTVKVMSFGYKEAPPPVAHMVFDVRFLKNPFWIPELRPLTGRDEPVQQYVLTQPLAKDFLETITQLVSSVLPEFVDLEIEEFIIAFGCTGGQHRSVSLSEELTRRLRVSFPDFDIKLIHRELAESGEELKGVTCGTGAATNVKADSSLRLIKSKSTDAQGALGGGD